MANRSLGALTLQLIIGMGGFTGPLSQAERELSKRTSAMEKRAYAFGKAIGISLKLAATVGASAFALITKNTIDAQREQAQLAAVLKSTGGAAGQSQAQLNKMADALQQVSTFAAGNVTEMQAVLLTFTKIQGDVFPKAQQAVLDMATALGMDLQGAAIQVGKALNDPIRGVTALGRAGVQFSEDQKKMIKSLVEAGKVTEAQTIILKELEVQFGGSALAARDTLGGALIALKNNFNDLLEGESGSDGVRGAVDAINDLSDTMSDPGVKRGAANIANGIASITAELIEGAAKFANWIARAKEAFDLDTGRLSAADASLDGLNRRLGELNKQRSDLSKGVQDIPWFLPDSGAQKVRIEELKKLGDEQLKIQREITQRIKNEKFADVVGGVVRPTAGFSGSTSGTKAKTGKSDAEKEAEKVARAIEQMTKAQQDWQNELNQTGNPIADEYASRLREITEQAKGFAEEGVPAEKVKAFTDEMQKLATSLRDSDIAEFQKEFNEASDQMAASMQGPMKQALLDYQIEVAKIDELLKLGIITIEDYNERLGLLTQQRDEPVTGMLDAIREEIMLLGMTNEEQEIYNNLKRAGAEAGSAAEQAIIAETKALQAFREEAQFLDDLKLGLSDMFVDFVSGAKSAKEAFGDFADAIYARAMQFVADKAVQALFDAFSGKGSSSSSSGSSTGGGLTGLFTSILGAFGGGKAGGGSVGPFSLNPVNERGPELLSVNGNDYLMMGANAGRITPNHALASGGDVTVNQSIAVQGRVDARSAAQLRQDSYVHARVAFGRNK